MNKRKIKFLCTLAAIMLTTTMVQDISVAAKTQAEINAEIQENKDKIESLEKEKEEIESEKTSEQSSLDEIKTKLDAKNKVLSETEAKFNETKSNIASLEETIESLSSDIKYVESEIEQKETEIKEKQESLDKRLRGMYKYNPGNQYLSLLLGSNSFGEFISTLTNIGSIVKTDNKLIAEVEEIKSDLVSKKETLDKKKEEAASKMESLNAAKTEYETLAKEYKDQVSELQTLESEKTAALNKLSDREKSIQEEISQFEEDNVSLEKYFASLSNSSNNSNSSGTTSNNNSGSSSNSSSGSSSSGSSSSGSSSSGSGSTSGGSSSGSVSSSGFMRPSAGILTSPYGPRIHPITGKQSFHKGIDLAAATGTPIMSTKAGTVTTAMYESSYGNMVIVDHGNGYSSLYAHLSQINVSVGQKVSQGQVVGLMGSTGNSTGPHLHFEIRINGSTVDPMNYIS